MLCFDLILCIRFVPLRCDNSALSADIFLPILLSIRGNNSFFKKNSQKTTLWTNKRIFHFIKMKKMSSVS